MIADFTPPINSSINSSTTQISIKFHSPVQLSTGNITIYKDSNDNIRQRVSANSTFCKLSNDGMVVNISIINSTFNENGTKYYVKIDNNFVKSKYYNEPLRGIESKVWLLESVDIANSSDTAATGLAFLTIDASNKFSNLSITDQLNYTDALLDEITDKVPVRRKRLSSDYKPQLFDEFGQITISIRIDLPNSNTENTVPGVFSNLNKMILYKNITAFCTNMTNDLDSTFGFRPIGELMTAF
ncbi:32817_t:CDS:2 [Racocetra persica]|uniref:32817_t:CDS:1 n=2 Tax=Racocetra persica TaxID=160502 RepID=A0ACA9LHN7_9GLOM|nr:32817_t:CDS:2 [Racocetra persica]